MTEQTTSGEGPEITVGDPNETKITRDRLDEVARWLHGRGLACVLIAIPFTELAMCRPADVADHAITMVSNGSGVDRILMLHEVNKNLPTGN